MTSALAPGLLIAVPQLADPNFRQSVVLLLQQGEDGAMGLVVNRESPILLADLCRDQKLGYHGDPTKKVRAGGPVQPEQGLVLYGAEHSDVDGQPILDGLAVSASTATLGALCERPEGRFHCYAGYAGWGPGQLEQEIREGSWIVGPATADLVLDLDPEAMWNRSLRDLGIDPALLVPGGTEEA